MSAWRDYVLVQQKGIQETCQRGNRDIGNGLIEDDVVVLEEDIAEDGEVQATVTEASDAGAIAIVGVDEVGGRDFEGRTSEGRGIAGDVVCAITIVSGTQATGHTAGDVVGEQEEGGAGVEDTTEAASAQSVEISSISILY
ncbi:hypothetical protein BC938DRAFT_479056 [Jimgerdemannia flammicorona]|uniref:Uncharacterized protein n=1 Tax=Jimgerdemannia flammicorona TaxID=994334 RepID=A0A433QLP9_9FUNG|nr:hypothetical protein BC938DRAFT_479056 [Jimgerdemannia flammicorona]